MVSVFLTGYVKIQHGKAKEKTMQLFDFVYGRFHHQLKETFIKTILGISNNGNLGKLFKRC